MKSYSAPDLLQECGVTDVDVPSGFFAFTVIDTNGFGDTAMCSYAEAKQIARAAWRVVNGDRGKLFAAMRDVVLSDTDVGDQYAVLVMYGMNLVLHHPDKCKRRVLKAELEKSFRRYKSARLLMVVPSWDKIDGVVVTAILPPRQVRGIHQ